MTATSGVTDGQVLITRIFEAPRERVFAAWTDPDQLAAWFGPAGYVVPRERISVDLRVGGTIALTMVRPDGGAEHAIAYEIVELDAPGLIVLRSEPAPGMTIVTRVELHAHGERTRMTLSDGPFPEPGASGAQAGWDAALDALDSRLAAGA